MSNKYKILNSNVSANTHEFLVDEIADIRFLPTEPGSTAIVAENSDVYICNNTKQWVKFDSVNGEETAFPSGKITITENGTDINIMQYATADVNVAGSGSEFGSIQYISQSTTVPEAGDGASAFGAADIARIGTNAEKALTDVRSSPMQGGFASGLYITFMPKDSDYTDCTGFIVTVSMQGVVETSVQSDLTFTLEVVEGYNSFGFTVPELQSGEYLILVPSKGEQSTDSSLV